MSPTRPMLPYLVVEIEDAVPGVFRLSHSALGSTDTLGTTEGVFILGTSHLGGEDPLAGPATSHEWRNVLPRATSVVVTRGGSREGLATSMGVGTATIVVRGDLDPTTDPAIHPGTRLRVRHSDGRVFFTGRIGRVTLDYPKDPRDPLTVVVVARDIVAELASITRYGAVSETGTEEWPARVRRIMRAAGGIPVALRALPALGVIAEADYTSSLGAQAEAEAWAGEWTATSGPPDDETPTLGIISAEATPAVREVSGLAVGGHYEARVRARFARGTSAALVADGRSSGPSIDHGGRWTWFTVEFTATHETHYLTLPAPEGMRPVLSGYRLTRLPGALITCADSANEFKLTRHLDMATTTGRAVWWPGTDGSLVASAIETLPAPSLAFADDGTAPRSYTALGATYDTDTSVSDLTLTNQTRALNEDGLWNVVETALQVRNLTAVATFGPAPREVTTNVYDPDPARDPIHGGALDALARALIELHPVPSVEVTSLTWDATSDTAASARLDLYDAITVAHRGEQHKCRVIEVTHTITPARWVTTLGLTGSETI